MASSSTASASALATGRLCPAFASKLPSSEVSAAIAAAATSRGRSASMRLVEIVCDRPEQQLLDASHHAALEVGQPLVLAAQPLAQERLVLLGHPLVEHRVDPAPERVEGGLAGQAVAQRARQALEVAVDVVEDDRLLRREVGEERARRDIGGGRRCRRSSWPGSRARRRGRIAASMICSRVRCFLRSRSPSGMCQS